MSDFEFKGRVTGDNISGKIIRAVSSVGVGAGGILGLFLFVWLLAIIAYVFMGKGDLVTILLLPIISVLAILYGIFSLISALAGVLIGWLF